MQPNMYSAMRPDMYFDGRTREEAVKKGLQALGLSRADALIIVMEGSDGFFGIGARPYTVRVTARFRPFKQLDREGPVFSPLNQVSRVRRDPHAPFLTRVISGLILGAICWGTGYLVGDALFSWTMGLLRWESSLMSFADRGFLEALFYLAVAIGVAIVGIPLVLIAGAVSLGTKYYVVPVLGFLAGFNPGIGTGVARAIRPMLGVVATIFVTFVDAVVHLPTYKTWRPRIIDLTMVLLLLAVAGGGWLVLRRAVSAPPPPPPVIEEQGPPAPTPEWHGSATENVLATVRSVSITPQRMAVTLRFENRVGSRIHFMFTNKIVARGGRGSYTLNGEDLTSREHDGRVPMRSAAAGYGDMVDIPPHAAVEGTYYFARPKEPRSFWELTFRWAENAQRDHEHGWGIYGAAASFDLRDGGALHFPFGVNSQAIQKALLVPTAMRMGDIRW